MIFYVQIYILDLLGTDIWFPVFRLRSFLGAQWFCSLGLEHREGSREQQGPSRCSLEATIVGMHRWKHRWNVVKHDAQVDGFSQPFLSPFVPTVQASEDLDRKKRNQVTWTTWLRLVWLGRFPDFLADKSKKRSRGQKQSSDPSCHHPCGDGTAQLPGTAQLQGTVWVSRGGAAGPRGGWWDILQGTNISPKTWAFWVDDFPNFPRWDMYPFPGGYHLGDLNFSLPDAVISHIFCIFFSLWFIECVEIFRLGLLFLIPTWSQDEHSETSNLAQENMDMGWTAHGWQMVT